jgi:hypothetical protein
VRLIEPMSVPTADDVTAGGVTILYTPNLTDPAFHGQCGAKADEHGTGDAVEGAADPQDLGAGI